jgi:hypothetical protein
MTPVIRSSSSAAAASGTMETDTAQLWITGIIVGCVLCGVLYDVELSPVARRLHQRSFRWRRLAIWLPSGLVCVRHPSSVVTVTRATRPGAAMPPVMTCAKRVSARRRPPSS